jgi:hypothetical protein
MIKRKVQVNIIQAVTSNLQKMVQIPLGFDQKISKVKYRSNETSRR